MIGRSKIASSSSRPRISEFCSLRFPKPRPGSITMRLRSRPSRTARCMAESSSMARFPTGSFRGGSLAHVSGVPRMWFKMSPAFTLAAARARSGSAVRPVGSLMISAPSSSAFAATPDLYVSTESGTVSRPCRRFRTGISRRSSSASDTRAEPGRMDSAPISMMSAPSSSSSMARANARSGSLYFPPSENESGVTFRIPITSVRSPSCRVLSRSFHS